MHDRMAPPHSPSHNPLGPAGGLLALSGDCVSLMEDVPYEVRGGGADLGLKI